MKNLFFVFLVIFIPIVLQAQNNGVGYDPQINDLFIYIIPVNDTAGEVVEHYTNFDNVIVSLSSDSTATGSWKANAQPGDTLTALIDNKSNLWHDGSLRFDFINYFSELDFTRGQDYQARARQLAYPGFYQNDLGSFGNSFFFTLDVVLPVRPAAVRIGRQ